MGLFSNSSSSSQTTKNSDLRIAAGDTSHNASTQVEVSGKAKGVNITTTDFGAVSASLQLALKGVEAANATTLKTVEANGGLLDGALRMAGDQQRAFTTSLDNTENADVRVLIVTGLAVVAFVAIAMFRKG